MIWLTPRCAELTEKQTRIYSVSSFVYLDWQLANATYLQIKSVQAVVEAVRACLQSIPWQRHMQVCGNLMLAAQAI